MSPKGNLNHNSSKHQHHNTINHIKPDRINRDIITHIKGEKIMWKLYSQFAPNLLKQTFWDVFQTLWKALKYLKCLTFGSTKPTMLLHWKKSLKGDQRVTTGIKNFLCSSANVTKEKVSLPILPSTFGMWPSCLLHVFFCLTSVHSSCCELFCFQAELKHSTQYGESLFYLLPYAIYWVLFQSRS